MGISYTSFVIATFAALYLILFCQLDIIGCLEVPSEPQLLLDEEYLQRPVTDKEDAFERCLDVWEKLKLKDSFVKGV